LAVFFRNVRGVIVFSGLTINTIFWFIPIFLLGIVKMLLPVKFIRRQLTRVLMAMGENWISVNRLVLAGSGAVNWRARGIDALRRDGWYLVLSNHQTWVDILVLQTVFNRRIPFLKFFIKQELVWFPILGIAWWALDMPFMERYSKAQIQANPGLKGRDMETTRKACEKFRDTPTSVINFVEGTRFTKEKHEKLNSPYKNLLVPKSGGIAFVLSAMGQYMKSILDVTIAYPGRVETFWEFLCSAESEIRVRVRNIPIGASHSVSRT